jgi:hypothetical protein
MGTGAIIATVVFSLFAVYFVVNYFKKRSSQPKTGVGVNNQDYKPGGPKDDPNYNGPK